MSDSFRLHGLYSPKNSPGQNIGVGSRSLLQGIFPTQGSNPGLPHCRQILHQLSHQGSPRILEWVAYPFSSRSSWLRNRTGISCIVGRFFTSWATREALLLFFTIYLFGSKLWHVRPLAAACGILVPWPGIEPRPPLLGAWSLTHWPIGAGPVYLFLKIVSLSC